MSRHGTVVVAMSGGVDSSVAALLLLEEGYEVVGITMKNWAFEKVGGNVHAEASCCSLGSVARARSVAHRLGIPHYVFDVSESFQEHVIDNFVTEYLNAHTPNPCIRCNTLVRWDTLLEKADWFDAEYVTTGHYARVSHNSTTGRYELHTAQDEWKDQTYVLYGLSQNTLARVRFPLGDLLKDEVRQRAAEAGLKVADAPESYEICFIPDNDYRRFIRESVSNGDALSPGEIADTEGNILGTHNGTALYTIGQRRGLGVALGEPAYVTNIDPATNRITVGDRAQLLSNEALVTELNWVGLERLDKEVHAATKIRSRHSGAESVLSPTDEGVRVRFDRPQPAVTPGQSAVFYDADRVLGGGVIVKSP